MTVSNNYHNDDLNDNELTNNNKINKSKIKNDKIKIYIKGNKNISGKQTLLTKPILEFYNNIENLKTLIPILDGTSIISLRLVDWFVTNYCKKYNTIFNINDFKIKNNKIFQDFDKIEDEIDLSYNGNNLIYNNFDNFILVHNNYKGQLKSHNKRHFDPFCRRNRIKLYYDNNKYFITTIGQLNFFKWAIETHILDYIIQNIKDIEEDMNTRNTKVNNTNIDKKKTKKKKKSSLKKKRKELSNCASKTLVNYKYPTVISFD
tara:strand:+ start:1121 stop:1903 length:783 start_codon:yes stop_codon:yes gene_type:complete